MGIPLCESPLRAACDFVVRVDHPGHPEAERTYRALCELARPAGGSVVVVGAGVEDDAEGQPDLFRWIDPHAALPPAQARNRGAAACTADLVAFVEEGCAVDPVAFESALAAFDREPGLGVLHAETAPRTDLLIVRREAFRAVGGFDERLRAGAEDDLVSRVQSRGWRAR